VKCYKPGSQRQEDCNKKRCHLWWGFYVEAYQL